MRNFPPDDASVLVVGCGVIGISAVAAIRALGSRARIVALAKYKFQADAALAYGADSVVFMRGKGGGSAGGSDYYSELAKLSEARLLQPIMGKRVVVGGFDYVFDCVGSSTSIDDSLRFTRPGGAMVLVGLASFPKGVDWTPIWMKEVQVKGSFWCSTEEFEGRRMRTYEVAMELMRTGRLDLSPLLTHKFRLADYRHAIEANSSTPGGKADRRRSSSTSRIRFTGNPEQAFRRQRRGEPGPRFRHTPCNLKGPLTYSGLAMLH